MESESYLSKYVYDILRQCKSYITPGITILDNYEPYKELLVSFDDFNDIRGNIMINTEMLVMGFKAIELAIYNGAEFGEMRYVANLHSLEMWDSHSFQCFLSFVIFGSNLDTWPWL